MWLTTNDNLSSSVIGFGSILMPNSAFTTWDYPLEENKIESNSNKNRNKFDSFTLLKPEIGNRD